MSSIRESLEAAATQADTAAVETSTEAPVAAETSSTPAPETETKSESGPARGPDGKFAKAEVTPTPKPKNGATGPEKPSTGATSTPATAAAEAAATPPPAAPKYKAPQSWRLALRDKFGGLPPEVQEEIDRTHRANEEGVRALRAKAAAADRLSEAYTPHAQHLGEDPFGVMPQLLQFAATMRGGTPQQKAAAIAQWVRDSNIPLEPLAHAIDNPSQQQGLSEADVARLVEQKWQARQQAADQERVQSEIASFGASREFFEDVRGEMSVIMGAAAHRGEAMTMEQAYEKACKLHPEVSEYISQRKAKEAAAAASQKAAAEKAAAVSVKTDPAGGGQAAKPKSIRAMLEASAEALGA